MNNKGQIKGVEPSRLRNSEPRVKPGHNAGTAGLKSSTGSVPQTGTLAMQAIGPFRPRLLDLHGTAAYLGVSAWTIRDLESAGVLLRVRLPLPNRKELRKILFDIQDLDRLINTWKEDRSLA